MDPRRSRMIAAAGLIVLVTASCADAKDKALKTPVPRPSSSSSTTSTSASDTTTTATVGPRTTATSAAPSGDPPRVRAVKVADFESAIALALRAGDDTIYVAEKGGRIKALTGDAIGAPVLDISSQVSTGDEQGLLGLAFSPSGDRLYVDYTDAAGDTRVVEYAYAGGTADTATRRELLFVDQPFPNHNGGNLVFGPDGFLYIGLGDGGSAGDPQGNGQRLGTLLGKILRIDPRPAGGRPYSIPPGNPFIARQGARPEIWAYGLRNPWRFSFDRETGDLWIGDVGQGTIEEVDMVAASAGGGQNYGWNRLEGTDRFAGSPPPAAVAPVHEYTHAGGNCSVTGGYVYRGGRMSGLRGSYVFSDYCTGDLRALVGAGGGNAGRSVKLGPTVDSIVSFGQDAQGELYALSLTSGLYRLEPAA